MAVIRGYGRRYGWDRRAAGHLKPENALNRAAQLMQVGRAEEANQTLYDIVTESQPRSRRQWTKTLESIMLQLMEYSVDLRKANMVKEALHKYRAMCINTNVQSVEDVVRALVKSAEAKTEAARKDIDDAFARSVVDDLEEGGTEAPDTLLLEAAGAEQSRERSDRQMVVPWMKFLWEVYRVVLDIVKSHVKLETCYHDISALAFKFCLKYERFMEFRRLCDMLRQHMQALMKATTQRTANDVVLLNPDTTQRFLETRFVQLQTAVELRHWQEAYRTVEDIHTLISIAKKAPRPQTMAIYYDNLMQVFWVSGNYLYHAHALYRLYNLSVRQNRNLSADDAQMMASRLLLAALSIPVHDAGASTASAGGGTGASADIYGSATDLSSGEHAARHQRMASLLGYSSPARRNTLLAELQSKQVLDLCHDQLKGLFEVLEGEMAPLQLAGRLAPVFEFISQHQVLEEYAAPIRRVAIYRLLEQLGRVYDVMRVDDVEKVVGFASIAEVEQIALEALKTRALGVRFDHQRKCIRFETALFATNAMRQQLGAMSRQLATAIKMIKVIDGDTVDGSADPGLVRRYAAIELAKNSAVSDQEALLGRKAVIEERRTEHERKAAEAEKEAKRLAAIERTRKEAEEEERRKRDKERREKERLKRDMEERERADLLRLKREIDEKRGIEVKPDEEEQELAEGLDRQELLTKQREDQVKALKEQEKKLTATARRMDYMERAMRQKQWPLLEDLQRHEAEEKVRRGMETRQRAIEEARAKHGADLVIQGNIKSFEAVRLAYTADLLQRVEADFDAWAASERQRLVEEEQLAREEEERQRQHQAELEAQKRREEEEAAEAERRRRLEEAEQERREAEREAELQRVEERKRAKEREMAERGNSGRYVPPRPGGQAWTGAGFGSQNRAYERAPGPSFGSDAFGRREGYTKPGGPPGSAAFGNRSDAPRQQPPGAGPGPGPGANPGSGARPAPQGPRTKRFINSKK